MTAESQHFNMAIRSATLGRKKSKIRKQQPRQQQQADDVGVSRTHFPSAVQRSAAPLAVVVRHLVGEAAKRTATRIAPPPSPPTSAAHIW
ncbi:hypothetical protein Q1695_014889 [Nippostrongylus brasiliensis]|nr:hypothetical protein Q1695_014889 [Nippostrongylus brasiliensis]